ncbi:MAG: hypothetical protein H7069_00045 [Phormidesmis sp. FL-bin-119]|nr:hypothetical protein [Pedobacter sp.]
MNKPIIWLIFIVVVLNLVLVCHLLSKLIYKLTFGKHPLRSGRFISGHGLGLSDKSIFDEWNNDDYSLLVSDITQVPLKICQPEKGKVWTWMTDIVGNSIFIPV